MSGNWTGRLIQIDQTGTLGHQDLWQNASINYLESITKVSTRAGSVNLWYEHFNPNLKKNRWYLVFLYWVDSFSALYKLMAISDSWLFRPCYIFLSWSGTSVLYWSIWPSSNNWLAIENIILVKLMRIHHGFSQLVVQNRALCALILRLVDFVVNENL